MEDRRLLASAALFRQLHEQKKDVYDVLTQFIRSAISWNASWTFNVTECGSALEKYFGFKIPDAVIRSCLKNRLRRTGELDLSHGAYSITAKFVKVDSLQAALGNIQSEQIFIIDKLIEFVERVTTKTLGQADRTQLSIDFHYYFLGGLKPCENSVLISEFIVKNSDSLDFTEKLNRVEEGLILYSGICHSSELANHAPWRSDFTIFLDTEVLFFSQGFNGTLHKKIFDDFHILVRETNASTVDGAKIELRYFEETKQEIEDFFFAAEKIVQYRQAPDPSKPAMIDITNGCNTVGDVLLKKARFFDRLKDLRILEEKRQNYYEPDTYVVEGDSTVQAVKKEHADLDLAVDKIARVLRLFTKINYLRRGFSNQGLEQSSAIFVSGKYITRVLAFSKLMLLEPKQVPFATDLDYLTERLWFKLNKGFGGNKVPTTFDVVARAQLILSTQAGNRVAEDYKSLINKVASGEMTNNNAGHLLSLLRAHTTKPEDFRPENIEEIASFFRSEFVEDAIRQKSVLERKAELAERSQEQVAVLEEQLRWQIAESQNESQQAKLRHIAQLRQRDASLRQEKLKPITVAVKRYFILLMSLVYIIPIGLTYLIIGSLQNTSDTPLSLLSAGVGLLPVLLSAAVTKAFSRYFSKKLKTLYRCKRRKLFPIRGLAVRTD